MILGENVITTSFQAKPISTALTVSNEPNETIKPNGPNETIKPNEPYETIKSSAEHSGDIAKIITEAIQHSIQPLLAQVQSFENIVREHKKLYKNKKILSMIKKI